MNSHIPMVPPPRGEVNRSEHEPFADIDPRVTIAWCVGDVRDAWSTREERWLAGARAPRRAEFCTGRVLARRALVAAGGVAGPIPVAPDRSPVWPAGWIGSLTHCCGLRAVAVAVRGSVAAIGIDAEDVTAADVLAAAEVLSATEQRLLHGQPLGHLLAFSTKESVIKAWSSHTGRPLSVHDLEVVATDAGSEGGFFHLGRRGDRQAGLGSQTLRADWRRLAEVVTTWVVVDAAVPDQRGRREPRANARPTSGAAEAR